MYHTKMVLVTVTPKGAKNAVAIYVCITYYTKMALVTVTPKAKNIQLLAMFILHIMLK